MKMGDRICLLNKGHVEQIDTPEGFVTNPKNDFVKQFMGDKLNRSVNELKLSEVTNQLSIQEGETKKVIQSLTVIYMLKTYIQI